MNKPAIIGALLLGVAGYAAASCSSKNDKGTTSTGGQSSNTGGGTSTGGQSSNAGGGNSATGGTSTGGSLATGGSLPFECGHADASAEFGEAGLVRVGYTDPQRSIVLQEGGHYSMPNSGPDSGPDPRFKGYCFTYDDKNGSTFYPPCGQDSDGGYRPCFTAATGLCVSANLGLGSVNTWGGGFGCNLGQVPNGSDLYVDVLGITSLTISVYGCAVPDQLQVQLNVVNAPADDAGTPGSGRFCNRATLGDPDANGVRSVTVPLAQLQQDCWLTGGPMFDASTMYVRSIQAQVNAIDGRATNWDFCVSQWTLQ
jgi:hypothetical protein